MYRPFCRRNGAELVLGQLAGEKAPRLVAELGDTLVDRCAGRSGRIGTLAGCRIPMPPVVSRAPLCVPPEQMVAIS